VGTSLGVEASLRDIADVRGGADWPRWRELARDAPPYLLPEFFALNAPRAEGQALIATASRSNGLVGALPLLLEGRALRALRSDQTPGYDYWGTPEGLGAIWRVLRRDRRWRELLLENVPAGSLLATQLPALAREDRCPVVVLPGSPQRFFALPGFEARLDSRFRMGLHRCERKAGGLELERIERPTRAQFEEAIAIEAMAWKAAAGTGIASDPTVGHMYRALLRLLGGRGRAHLYFLRAGGDRIAVLIAVEDAQTLYALKVGYDPRHSALGPGHLLFWKVAAEAERRGLRELRFLGRDAEWKHKWTDETHEHVSLRVYRRSARGLAIYALREVIKPRLPEPMRDLRTPLRRGCQRGSIVGVHSLFDRLRGRLRDGLGIRSGILRALQGRSPAREPLGEPSRFAPGDWVRVLEEPAIRTILDGESRLRGLKFIPQQWASCGRVYRVQKQVRRMRDDRGGYRPISRTVLLEGASCAGEGPGPAGCGRHCPTMYRDEWLEPAPRQRLEPPRPGSAGRRHARVRGVDEIVAGLDLAGRRDGLMFMPEMAQYAGRRASIVEAIPKVFEYDRWVATRRPIYVLEGLHCSGSVPGEPGPCDRACALLWHEDWLLIEPAAGKSER
jgi:hypothetical protein